MSQFSEADILARLDALSHLRSRTRMLAARGAPLPKEDGLAPEEVLPDAPVVRLDAYDRYELQLRADLDRVRGLRS